MSRGTYLTGVPLGIVRKLEQFGRLNLKPSLNSRLHIYDITNISIPENTTLTGAEVETPTYNNYLTRIRGGGDVVVPLNLTKSKQLKPKGVLNVIRLTGEDSPRIAADDMGTVLSSPDTISFISDINILQKGGKDSLVMLSDYDLSAYSCPKGDKTKIGTQAVQGLTSDDKIFATIKLPNFNEMLVCFEDTLTGTKYFQKVIDYSKVDFEGELTTLDSPVESITTDSGEIIYPEQFDRDYILKPNQDFPIQIGKFVFLVWKVINRQILKVDFSGETINSELIDLDQMMMESNLADWSIQGEPSGVGFNVNLTSYSKTENIFYMLLYFKGKGSSPNKYYRFLGFDFNLNQLTSWGLKKWQANSFYGNDNGSVEINKDTVFFVSNSLFYIFWPGNHGYNPSAGGPKVSYNNPVEIFEKKQGEDWRIDDPVDVAVWNTPGRDQLDAGGGGSELYNYAFSETDDKISSSFALLVFFSYATNGVHYFETLDNANYYNATGIMEKDINNFIISSLPVEKSTKLSYADDTYKNTLWLQPMSINGNQIANSGAGVEISTRATYYWFHNTEVVFILGDNKTIYIAGATKDLDDVIDYGKNFIPRDDLTFDDRSADPICTLNGRVLNQPIYLIEDIKEIPAGDGSNLGYIYRAGRHDTPSIKNKDNVFIIPQFTLDLPDAPVNVKYIDIEIETFSLINGIEILDINNQNVGFAISKFLTQEEIQEPQKYNNGENYKAFFPMKAYPFVNGSKINWEFWDVTELRYHRDLWNYLAKDIFSEIRETNSEGRPLDPSDSVYFAQHNMPNTKYINSNTGVFPFTNEFQDMFYKRTPGAKDHNDTLKGYGLGLADLSFYNFDIIGNEPTRRWESAQTIKLIDIYQMTAVGFVVISWLYSEPIDNYRVNDETWDGIKNGILQGTINWSGTNYNQKFQDNNGGYLNTVNKATNINQWTNESDQDKSYAFIVPNDIEKIASAIESIPGATNTIIEKSVKRTTTPFGDRITVPDSSNYFSRMPQEIFADVNEAAALGLRTNYKLRIELSSPKSLSRLRLNIYGGRTLSFTFYDSNFEICSDKNGVEVGTKSYLSPNVDKTPNLAFEDIILSL